jgi:hypothetical protein
MSDGKLLNGQQYDPTEDLVVRFTERMRDIPGAATQLGNTKTEITPHDQDASVVRVYTDPTGLDTLVRSSPSFVTLQLPDILESITVEYNENQGAGSYTESGIGSSGGDHQDLDISANNSAQASYSIVPELVISIKQVWAANIRATRYFFYMTGTIDTTTILARLTTIVGSAVNFLPVFRPMQHTLVLKGQSMSVRVEAKAVRGDYASPTFSRAIFQTGRGFSTDGGVTVRSVTIPPTLHSLVSIANNVKEGRATATASAIVQINGAVAAVVQTNETPIQRASVTPTSLIATSPAGIPTSGFYLVDLDFTRELKWGRTAIFAEVVDFSQFV